MLRDNRPGFIRISFSGISCVLSTTNSSADTPVPQQNSTAQDPFDENDEISLLALDRIPQPLHGDPVFSAYSCAIGLMPIRFVVGDPTTNPPVIYEKSVILNWLARNPINPTSPISRRPLQPDQLLPRPGIQALIDSRLALYSKGLNEYLSTNVNTPVDETIIAQAKTRTAEHSDC